MSSPLRPPNISTSVLITGKYTKKAEVFVVTRVTMDGESNTEII